MLAPLTTDPLASTIFPVISVSAIIGLLLFVNMPPPMEGVSGGILSFATRAELKSEKKTYPIRAHLAFDQMCSSSLDFIISS
jgi:hypothetical protein